MKNRWMLLSVLALCGLMQLTAQVREASRERISLAGLWGSSLGACVLPGTTDENKLGEGNQEKNDTHQLTRPYPFSGIVEYTREIEIPSSFAGKRFFLEMERTKPSTLWVDGDSIGSYSHIYAPHRYELPVLTVGRHQLRIRVDNSETSVPKEIQGSHAWTDATQTNWNGILGDFFIEAVPAAYIQTIQVYPDVTQKHTQLCIRVWSDVNTKAMLTINGEAWNTADSHILRTHTQMVTLRKGNNIVWMVIAMGDNPLLWSEFHPALYKLEVVLDQRKQRDVQEVNFGMREFTTQGNRFLINGNIVFLRGKHDSCVFPLTGYGPMNVAEWQRVFRISKEYGINHFRCHSYTPPRAALEAADIEGIYFQLELPLWGTITKENPILNEFMKREGDMILEYYGNHPSFTMLGLGNELDIKDRDIVRGWLDDFRSKDNRHLYCYGSNNNLGWFGAQEGEDFLVTCRVGGGEGYSTHIRSSFAYVDAEKGGILNNTRPATTGTYSEAIALSPRPVVGHETCQFQIYPDYSEIDKYKGVLYPYNLEIFRNRLQENALSNQAKDFHYATGRFSIECYKADMEYAFRTPGFGGFQLLDLQDFPGQGSALVGILDAFMDSKDIVEPHVFYGFCAPLVPLAIFADHCWFNTQTLKIDVAISNYLEQEWNEEVQWKLVSAVNGWTRHGVLNADVKQGDVSTVGSFKVPLEELITAQQLTLTLSTGKYKNYYNFWVYPDTKAEVGVVYQTSSLDAVLKQQLEKGSTVLFTPNHAAIELQSVGGLFTPDYWNYAMFKTISENAGKEVSPGTLSILTDPTHPMMLEFPTQIHSNWQWWSISRNSRPMILNATRAEYKPIVQVVDNIERNHKLGLVYEFAVGKGKLLVCMTDLEAIASTPEGNQFRTALLNYANSDSFQPTEQITWEKLKNLFEGDVNQREIKGVKNESDYLKP